MLDNETYTWLQHLGYLVSQRAREITGARNFVVVKKT